MQICRVTKAQASSVTLQGSCVQIDFKFNAKLALGRQGIWEAIGTASVLWRWRQHSSTRHSLAEASVPARARHQLRGGSSHSSTGSSAVRDFGQSRQYCVRQAGRTASRQVTIWGKALGHHRTALAQASGRGRSRFQLGQRQEMKISATVAPSKGHLLTSKGNSLPAKSQCKSPDVHSATIWVGKASNRHYCLSVSLPIVFLLHKSTTDKQDHALSNLRRTLETQQDVASKK